MVGDDGTALFAPSCLNRLQFLLDDSFRISDVQPVEYQSSPSMRVSETLTRLLSALVRVRRSNEI